MELVKKSSNEKKPKRIKGQYLATPAGSTDIHIFEVEYEEIAPGNWKKVEGTEKDLGSLQKDKKEN